MKSNKENTRVRLSAKGACARTHTQSGTYTVIKKSNSAMTTTTVTMLAKVPKAALSADNALTLS